MSIEVYREHGISRMRMSLFNYKEKGSREWSTFGAIEGDKVSREVYRVKVPVKTAPDPERGTVVPIRRYNKPNYLFPKAAH